VNEQDRQGLVDLLQRYGEEVQEYLAAINDRPVTVTTVVQTRRSPQPNWLPQWQWPVRRFATETV
jgi:hypothetical protein